ncbi:DUF6470 family protein [Camelliibacillus cellulosilyticus]|uniref:DUF6470 family protein n=1 Tax=Camelliibacillus cellulosilyticus TaxID=2174486 RepID=A0ABV9GLV2_9BACL
MNMPHLIIHSQPAKIAMKTTPARLDPQFGKTDVSIEQPPAEMKIRRTPSKLTIDQTEAWNNLDLKSAFVRIQEAAGYGRQAVLDGIARRARQGEALIHIESKGNPIADQAKENSVHEIHYDTGHVPPFLAVKSHYDPGSVTIDWQTHAPIYQTKVTPPTGTYYPGHVDISVSQFPSVTIDVASSYVDQRI